MQHDPSAPWLARVGFVFALGLCLVVLWLLADARQAASSADSLLAIGIFLVTEFLAFRLWRYGYASPVRARSAPSLATDPASPSPSAFLEGQGRLLFDESPLPKWVYDLQTLQILAVNRTALHRYGYTEAEFLRLTIRDIRPPEDIPALEADVPPGAGLPPRVGEWRHRTRDGRLLDVVVSGHDIAFAGRTARMVSIVDISDRKRVERELRASERRFRVLAESLPQIVWTCDPDGVCDFFNPPWFAYTGRAAPESLGHAWFELVHSEDRMHVQTGWDQAVALGAPFDLEFRLRRADGQYRRFALRVLPLEDASDAIVQWFATATAIDGLQPPPAPP